MAVDLSDDDAVVKTSFLCFFFYRGFRIGPGVLDNANGRTQFERTDDWIALIYRGQGARCSGGMVSI